MKVVSIVPPGRCERMALDTVVSCIENSSVSVGEDANFVKFYAQQKGNFYLGSYP